MFQPIEQQKVYQMPIHSQGCEGYLTELLCTPINSIDHRIAEDVSLLADVQIRDYLLVLMDEDPPGSRPIEIAMHMWPLLQTEVSA